MIVKIGSGGRFAGLMVYLQGEGKANEHTHPHLVAGSPELMATHDDNELSRAAAFDIARSLDGPRQRWGTEVNAPQKEWSDEAGKVVKVGEKPAHVYHLILSASPEDGALSSQQWGEIAQRMMDRLGFTEASGKAPAPWAAVHHGENAGGADHVHIVASRIRTDGTKVSTWNDFRMASEECRQIEKDFGLYVIEGRENGRGEPGLSRSEFHQAREDAREPAREELRRVLSSCSVESSTEAEFVRRVRKSGSLIRPRFAAGRDDVVTGYSVALRPPTKDQKPIWFGAGSVGKEFALPTLREDFTSRGVDDAQHAVDEWRAAWKGGKVVHPGREGTVVDQEQIARVDEQVDQWTRYVRSIPVANTQEWARAAQRTSGVMRTLATRLGPEDGAPLRKLARTLDKSAVPPPVRAARDRQQPRLTGAAMVLAQSSKAMKPATAYALLLQQIVKTIEMIAAAEQAAGRARSAAALTAELRGRYAEITAKHPKVEEPEFVMAARAKSAEVRARLETRLPADPTAHKGMTHQQQQTSARVTASSDREGTGR